MRSFFAQMNLYGVLSEKAQIFFILVETSISYEFSKMRKMEI